MVYFVCVLSDRIAYSNLFAQFWLGSSDGNIWPEWLSLARRMFSFLWILILLKCEKLVSLAFYEITRGI